MPGDLVSQVGANPVELAGDLIGLGNIVATIFMGRLGRAGDFERRLEEATGYTAEEIAGLLQKADETAELVATALDSASRSTDERKRALLARAAAAGVVGDEQVEVDHRLLFVRTLDQLDVPHMKLLVLVARTERSFQGGAVRATGGWAWQDILASWPGVADSLAPLMAVLQREGLVEDTSIPGAIAGIAPTWNATSYGNAFVDFVVRHEPTIRPE